jgi:hypothetical protein
MIEQRYKGMIGLEYKHGLKIAILAFKSNEERQQ